MKVNESVFGYDKIKGRYVVDADIADFSSRLSSAFKIKEVGVSVEGRSIQSVQIGHGSVRILMWSQMHGNESTTTKSVVDLMWYLNEYAEIEQELLSKVCLLIIPMLNPDGAQKYERCNANGVDLNRDALLKTQPESQVLRRVFETFEPDYAFNLHDQRSIFGAGTSGAEAAVSLLAPSYDEERSVNGVRKEAMQLVVGMHEVLKSFLQDKIGRFDDGFNLNCVGDYFQWCGVPTVLVEAGHYGLDYEREGVRLAVCKALLEGVRLLADRKHLVLDLANYSKIPENIKNFVDVRLNRVWDPVSSDFYKVTIDYKEELCEGRVIFLPIISDISKKATKFAHLTVNDDLKFKMKAVDVNTFIDKNAIDCLDFYGLDVNDLLKKQ